MSDGNFKRVRVTQVVDRHWEQIGRDDEHNVAKPVFYDLFLERNKLSVDTKDMVDGWGRSFGEAVFSSSYIKEWDVQ